MKTRPDKEDLEQLRAVEQADVYKAGRPAAALTRTINGVEFRYLDEWVVAGGPAVATTLPVVAEPVVRSGGALPWYFAGLLPEGRRLGALRRAVKTSADDELSLLLAVGADTIGDVQVVPAGMTPVEVPPRIAIENVGDASFAELLTELGVRAQRIALPDRDDVPGLVIRRFDRITVDGQPRALAVEDGCQAADRPPADKYLLGADRVFATLTAVCDAPAVAGRELIRQLVFAYLIGDGDAHAKNFSVLQNLAGEWKVSPVYDVPCSYLYGDTTMALSIDGRSGGDFGTGHFIALGSRLAVPERAVRHVMSDLAARVDRWLPALDELPFDRGRISKLRRMITRRQQRLERA